MSVGYSMEYSVVIHGSRADVEKIPAVVQKYSKDYTEKHPEAWDQSYYEDMAEYIASSAQKALDSGEDPLTCQMENSDGDDSHGILEEFLTALDTQLPNLAIAASAIYVDTEYGEGSFGNLLYSPPGSSALDLNNFSGLEGRKDPLPDENWIPYGWRHPEVEPPEAKAEGKLSFLGPWGEPERAVVERALLGGGVLEAVSVFQPSLETNAPPFAQEGDGVAFSLTGPLNFGDAAQNLEQVLSPYLEQHKETYAALCKTMREKKLSLHLLLDEYTGPNAAWTYSDHSKWDFILSSDGERLVSNFARCATYSFSSFSSSGKSEDQAAEIYEKICEMELDELPSRAQAAVRKAISDFMESHPMTDSPNKRKRMSKIDIEGIDKYEFLKWLDKNWDRWANKFPDWMDPFTLEQYESVLEMKQDRENCRNMPAVIKCYLEEREGDSYFTANHDALLTVIQEAIQSVPARYIPTEFDQRFKGKRFVVKGDLDGYEEGQAAELVEKFGGKVMKNVTASVNYFVCGSGVGDPIRTAMKHGTTILTADYFEDMTR